MTTPTRIDLRELLRAAVYLFTALGMMAVLGTFGYALFAILGMGHDGWNPSEEAGKAGGLLGAGLGLWLTRAVARHERRERRPRNRKSGRRWTWIEQMAADELQRQLHWPRMNADKGADER